MIPSNEIAELWRKHASGLKLLVQARFASHSRGNGWSGSAGCDGDDLVQEAFIRLSQQKRVPDEPLAWLARTSRNLAIDAVRSGVRRKEREQASVEMRGVWFQSEAGDGLVAEEVTAALQELPTTEREIVVAHIWNGMSFRQIAEAFDTSSSNANRSYQTAIRKMRVAIEGTPLSDSPHDTPGSANRSTATGASAGERAK